MTDSPLAVEGADQDTTTFAPDIIAFSDVGAPGTDGIATDAVTAVPSLPLDTAAKRNSYVSPAEGLLTVCRSALAARVAVVVTLPTVWVSLYPDIAVLEAGACHVRTIWPPLYVALKERGASLGSGIVADSLAVAPVPYVDLAASWNV